MTETQPEYLEEHTSDEPIRIMVVADPGFVGDKVCKIIDDNPNLVISAQVVDGVSAVSALRRQVIDAVVIDIGHPQSQIKVTLTRMFRVDPQLKVLMVGSLNFSNVKTSMMGLMEGAAEFIATPSAHTRKTEKSFVVRLVELLLAFGRTTREIEVQHAPLRRNLPMTRPVPRARRPISFQQASKYPPEILAFGSSTGGPQALFTVLAMLPADLKQPVFITQHMPPTFTALLASHINKHSALVCAEGKDGELVQPSRIYLAPGDYHMTVEDRSAGPTIILDQKPPINFCRPAVDPLFISLARVYGANILATILTGMGKDGCIGGQAIVDAGGTVIAQDEESSVVWGMPGAAAEAGICSSILPLDDIASFINQALKKDW